MFLILVALGTFGLCGWRVDRDMSRFVPVKFRVRVAIPIMGMAVAAAGLTFSAMKYGADQVKEQIKASTASLK